MAISDAHPGRLSVAAVRALSPYVPGKPIAELEREYGVTDIAKLASNENPWGPSPAALDAMRRSLDDIWLYPDGSGHELKQALAGHLSVGTDCLTLGNGSNELLMLLAEAFLTADCSAVYSQYGFAIYPLVIKATGARAIEVQALSTRDAMPLGHDLTAMAAAIDSDTRLVFVANPNNPTGTWATPPQLLHFIQRVPAHALVVLDEAYLEYGHHHGCQDGIGWLKHHPNLVLLRTFSKAYGLAGARVGYGVSHPEIAEVLNRLRPAFNINSLALAGASAAIADQPHMQRCVAQTSVELLRVKKALQTLGLEVLPSAANFLLVRVGAGAAQIYDHLLRGGVIVRMMAGYGLPEYLRISIGKPAQNERLLVLLSKLVGKNQ